MKKVCAYLRLLRVKHYTKNLLVFFPLIFHGRLFDPELFIVTLLAFGAFCCVSSAVYIINDVRDVETDRKHETKKERPLASGEISRQAAYVLLVLMLIGAVVFNAMIVPTTALSWIILFGYFALNVAYSLGLKNVALVDVSILVCGYVLRVFYGSVVTGITVSHWLFLTLIAFSLYLAFGKRRGELAQRGTASRDVLAKYPDNFLDTSMTVFLTLTLAFYSLWSVDVAAHAHDMLLVWTVPLVIAICLRYHFVIAGDSDGDPVEVVVKDPALMLLVAGYAIAILSVLYFSTMSSFS